MNAKQEAKLDECLRLLRRLTLQGEQNMPAINDALAKLQSDLTAETSASAAIENLLTTVNAQLQAALQLGDPAAIVAQVSAISTGLETNTAGLVSATVANTTAAAPASTPPAT